NKSAILFTSAFGDNNDCELFPEVFPFLYFCADALVTKRNLRNQNHIGTAGDSGVKGDPTGVTPHDFKDHDAIVAFSGSVQPIERIGRARHSRIKSEREKRSFQIVVDRLWHPYDGDHVLDQLLCDAQGAVSADGDEGKLIQRFHASFHAVEQYLG